MARRPRTHESSKAMTFPHILQTIALAPELEAALAARFDVHPLWRETDPAAFLADHGARFTGLATTAMAGASNSTTSCCCRTSPAARTRPAAPWAS